MEHTRVAIVGGGPAGYVAARRLGQLGVDTVLVERRALGGVCLNEGCIPTKALYVATTPLGRTEAWATAGIALHPQVDLARLRAWLDKIVTNLRAGIEKLLSAVGVEVIPGEAALIGPGQLRIRRANREEMLAAQAIVLATGSAPIEVPGLPFDGERVWSSTDALNLPRVPEHLVVVGGGVIGLELATVYCRLGSHVTVVEMMDGLLPGLNLSRRGEALLRQALRRQGIELRLGAAAQGLTEDGVVVRSAAGTEEVPGDAVLVAVGRRPRPEGLGLEHAGIRPERGFVPTDQGFLAAPGIYAIGDLRGGALLAHKASHEGLLLAEWLAQPSPMKGDATGPLEPPSSMKGEGVGHKGRRYNNGSVASGFIPDVGAPDVGIIPQAIFTQPEVALVGLSPEAAAAQGIEVRVGRCPLGALGRAWAEGELDGYFQVVADRGGRLLGAEIVGPHASDLIAEAALAIQAGLTLAELAQTVHAHPTFPEGLWEAALAALDRPLHTA
ncbi:FAD-dependent oxidoreductase [Candidatus Bipolaricaulota bacterium]|nr:FAD-dependent oxidoreductase [Candidatus Bipolaricaulota bacterium]